MFLHISKISYKLYVCKLGFDIEIISYYRPKMMAIMSLFKKSAVHVSTMLKLQTVRLEATPRATLNEKKYHYVSSIAA